MPPPQLPPDERGESVEAPVPGPRRHIGKLFWVGVAIAPIAALLLALGNGVGPLRAAAALAILSVVIIGLSVVIRDDAAMVKDDVEEQLRTEVDGLRAEIEALRRGVEVSVHRELERVHHELAATRRDSVIRAESSRINGNRLTGGALPPAEDDYADERGRRGANAGGRGQSERRAITARADAARADAEAQAQAAADGYSWFGDADSPEAQAAGRSEPIRYEAGTYGASGTTYGTARADTSDTGRRRRAANTYGSADANAASAKPAGTEYGSPAGTEYGSSAGRREATTYGSASASASAAESPEEQSGRRRRGHRRAEQEPGSFEAPSYQAADYEVVGYDEAPPVYGGSDSYRGSRAAHPAEESHQDAGTVDYTEFWTRSASPQQATDRDAGAEWSSWRGNDRYDREDPQVITGAITGAIYDVPYTVGGQSLSEPQFGAGNGFGSAGGFGSGNGFPTDDNNGYPAGEPRWDDPPPVSWSASASEADQPPAAEFELPNLDHLPAADGSAADSSPENTGGRHASADQRREGRYQSW